MISRMPFLSYFPILGQYRHGDVLQIIPPKASDPRPLNAVGWHGGTLAVAFDASVAPERMQDWWAHDHRERERVLFLTDQVGRGIGSQNWLNSVLDSQRNFYRRRAIEQEALRLLQVFTSNLFRRVCDSEYDWFEDPITSSPVFAKRFYPSFVDDHFGEFWRGSVDRIHQVDPAQHFDERRVNLENTAIDLLSDLDSRFDSYFALPPKRKVSFSRACELFGNGQEIWRGSRSLSLVAYVFAVDALCHADDPNPARCPDCNNLRSETLCASCGGPRFGLTRRFRDFVDQFIQEDKERKFSARLFAVRSEIAHRGELLRSDEFDAGFNVGGADDQSDLERGVGRTVQKIILGWLTKQTTKATN